MVSAAFTLAAYAIAAAASAAFAGPLPGPPAHLLLAAGGWLTVNTAVAFLLGLGLSALIRSRSTTVAVLLGLTLVVTPIAAQVSALPDIRQGLPGIALYQLQPRVLGGTGTQSLTMTTTAIAVGHAGRACSRAHLVGPVPGRTSDPGGRIRGLLPLGAMVAGQAWRPGRPSGQLQGAGQ